MIAAVVGGGVKLSQLEIVKFASVARQIILFGLGLVLLLVGLGMAMSSRDEKTTPGDGGSLVVPPKDDAGPPGPATGNAAVARPPVAVRADPEREDDESSSAPAQIGGLWATSTGVMYRFDQEGRLIGVTISNGLSGSGAVEGDRITFYAAPAECGGPILPDGRTINLTCAYHGMTEDVIIRRQ
jgi:hypothetical protein